MFQTTNQYIYIYICVYTLEVSDVYMYVYNLYIYIIHIYIISINYGIAMNSPYSKNGSSHIPQAPLRRP